MQKKRYGRSIGLGVEKRSVQPLDMDISINFSSINQPQCHYFQEKVELVAPPEGSAVGERLSFEGVAGGPFDPVSAAQMEKKKVLDKVLPVSEELHNQPLVGMFSRLIDPCPHLSRVSPDMPHTRRYPRRPVNVSSAMLSVFLKFSICAFLENCCRSGYSAICGTVD